MSKKINLKTVVQNFEDAKVVITDSFSLSESSHNSSGKFNNDEAMVVQHFLSLMIYVCYEFYDLQNASSKLSQEKICIIQDFQTLLLTELHSEDPSNNVISLSQTLLGRIQDLENHTKNTFNELKFVDFDDNYFGHLGAFKAKNKSEIPPKNMLIRMNFGDIHIRCGISITDSKQEVKIMDVVNKRDA